MITTLKLPFDFNAEALHEDLRKFSPAEWVPHFNTSYYDGDWSGIALRATKDAHVSLYPDPTATAYEDTEMMKRCQYMPQIIDSFKCELETVRLLKLGAGSKIKEHSDYMLGLEDGVARIHIPAQTNPQVEFLLNGEPVKMREGEAWYLNFNLRHSVDNSGGDDRIHLVIDCIANDWLRSFFPD